MEKIQLRSPQNKEEWEKLHQLRREGIFVPHYPETTYDSNHPNDSNPNHHPLVFVVQNKVVGTARLDELGSNRIAVRLIVIDTTMQNKGLGRALIKELETYAKKLGASELLLNSLESVVGFYKKMGFEITEPFDKPADHTLSVNQTPMRKKIGG